MARLIYAEAALQDLGRLADFLVESDPTDAGATIDLIARAVSMLDENPLVGRPVEAPLRELVVSRGRTGHVALYSFEAAHDVVLVLAIRHQREAGYADEMP